MIKMYLKLWPLFVLFLMASCVKSDSDVVGPNCTPTLLPEQIRTVNVIDPKNTAVKNPTIAVFRFSQLLQSYQETQCKNRMPNCNVSLMVKNTSSKKLQFDYTVHYMNGGNTWEYEGYSVIEANDTDNIGIISRNCSWITTGTLVITTGNISYQ